MCATDEPVYCRECRFFRDYAGRGPCECRAEVFVEHTPIRPRESYADPLEKNAENDCPDFAPDLLTLAWKWVIGLFA